MHKNTKSTKSTDQHYRHNKRAKPDKYYTKRRLHVKQFFEIDASSYASEMFRVTA